MKRLFLILTICLYVLFGLSPLGCHGQNKAIMGVKPITGTWINLAYQDVRNKYTNPQHFDHTDPALWRQKVKELSEMGIEYLVFMAVANEGKAYYPSKLMPHVYPSGKESPVDAIMDMAGELGLKVFMSTGWAKNQDDNLQDPAIKQRQLQMMEELAALYKNHTAFYGWYLPVEDCLCPIFAEHAVQAVNTLVEKAKALTPGKKTLISPYGIVDSAFDDPAYEKQLAKLKVDIIAYQDEVGCVREQFPLPRLKRNWKKLRAIHDKLDIALWANCETFTWENHTNDRSSALIPAAYPRLLSQQAAASAAEVETIISFMMYSLFDKPSSSFQLGQSGCSNKAYMNYMDWSRGETYWGLLGASFMGTLKSKNSVCTESKECGMLIDSRLSEENPKDTCWAVFTPGYHELLFDLGTDDSPLYKVMLRGLNYVPENIGLPETVSLSVSDDGKQYHLISMKTVEHWTNAKHDAWIEGVLFDKLNLKSRYVKVAFESSYQVYLDEIFFNPTVIKE